MLYAEYLLNIRQVTIFATLSSEQNRETTVELSADRKSVSVTHDGETSTVELPVDVIGPIRKYSSPSETKQLCFRLQVPSTLQLSHPPSQNDENIIPWSARCMSKESEFACRECKSLIISGRVGDWSDLPNENWAELMEFWHCHKPQDGFDQDVKSSAPGINTFDKPRAQRGKGLVDICHLVFAPEDCCGLKVCKNHE